jgi:hypothetical protein
MKKIIDALANFWAEFKAQVFTLVGLFIAWVLLEGEAKTIVGYATIGAIIVWLAPGKKR